jgi:hypothetical protein
MICMRHSRGTLQASTAPAVVRNPTAVRGFRDHIVPFAHGQHVVDRLPDAELYHLPGESHLAGLGFAEEILHTMVELWDTIDKS